MKVFKYNPQLQTPQEYIDAEQPVGEVITTDVTGCLGAVMLNLETLFSYEQGNFVAINGAMTSSEGNTNQAISTEHKLHYIATFKPSWFHGLDEKTNLQVPQ